MEKINESITKEEIFQFLRRCFPYCKHYGKERVISFEIFEDELKDNFLNKAFKEDFISAPIILSSKVKEEGITNSKELPYFKSITIAGVYKLELKVRDEKD